MARAAQEAIPQSVCTSCKEKLETPGRTGLCHGCLIAAVFLPQAYQQWEQYRLACPHCGKILRRIGPDPTGRTSGIHECPLCGPAEGSHRNATCCPATGVRYLDAKGMRLCDLAEKHGVARGITW